MSVTVRTATIADADSFLSLIDALANYEALAPPDSAAKARLVSDAFETDRPRFVVYLAGEPGEDTLGYAVVFETYSTFLARPTLYLEDFFVRPDARGKGVGDALFSHCLSEAKARGCGRMEWTCLEWNELAQRFYDKRSAKHLDDWRMYRIVISQ